MMLLLTCFHLLIVRSVFIITIIIVAFIVNFFVVATLCLAD